MTVLKLTIESIVNRVLKHAVTGIAPTPASRKVTFVSSSMEQAKPSPVFSEDAVKALASTPGVRFPSLREKDL